MSNIVHPCDIGNGGCGQICNRDGDDAVCACEEGFELGSDGKSCSKGEYVNTNPRRIVSIAIMSSENPVLRMRSKCHSFKKRSLNHLLTH